VGERWPIYDKSAKSIGEPNLVFWVVAKIRDRLDQRPLRKELNSYCDAAPFME
jgi:hypothetical protein